MKKLNEIDSDREDSHVVAREGKVVGGVGEKSEGMKKYKLVVIKLMGM